MPSLKDIGDSKRVSALITRSESLCRDSQRLLFQLDSLRYEMECELLKLDLHPNDAKFDFDLDVGMADNPSADV